MSAPVVRPAASADWPAVAALLAELGRPDVRGTADEDRHHRSFERYLERPDVVALVAETGGAVAGFCNVEFRGRLNHLTDEAWIPELIVGESARSSGLGAALLSHAAEVVRERGAHVMVLESAHWRTRAHAFYRREGWLDVGLAFTRMPDGGEIPPNPRRT